MQIRQSIEASYRIAVTAVCGGLLSACMAQGSSPDAEPAAEPMPVDEAEAEAGAGSLADRLSEPMPLAIAGSSADGVGSLIHVQARGLGDQELSRDLELAVLGGHIDVRALDGERMVIRDFAIDIGALSLPEGIVRADVRFGGVRAHIEAPHTFECDWNEARDRARAVVDLEVVVDWGVSVDGSELHPLAPVRIESLPVELELERTGTGAVRAGLAGVREGVFYEWGNLVEFSTLAVDVRADGDA